MRTIAVVNRKGGSGKTTTAVSLAAVLAERGSSVLLIDLDPQASASAWLGASSEDRGLFDAFVGTRDLGSLAVRTNVPGLDLLPSSPWLHTAEQTLKGDMSVGVFRAIERLRPDWDFVIVDCPPSLSYLAVGALLAVREVIIPVEAHSIALWGVAAVVREMSRIQSDLNPHLRSPLIVACRLNRTVHARSVVDELDRTYGWRLAWARIRESIRLAEAEAARMPITAFSPQSGACLHYRLLADEVLGREEVAEPSSSSGSRLHRLLTRTAQFTAFPAPRRLSHATGPTAPGGPGRGDPRQPSARCGQRLRPPIGRSWTPWTAKSRRRRTGSRRRGRRSRRSERRIDPDDRGTSEACRPE